MERLGNFLIKAMIAFLLILVLFDLLDYSHVIYAETEDVLTHLGQISIFDWHFSFEPVIWFLFSVYRFFKLAGLLLFGFSGLGSVIYLVVVFISRVFFKGQFPFFFALKMMVVSLLGVYCSQYAVISDFFRNLFSKF